MKAVADPQIKAATVLEPPIALARAKAIRNIRRLIWLYLGLLIFEGTLRKWIVPQLSTPLLLVRDPIVLAIYILAIRARVLPQNRWIVSLEIIAAASWAAGILVMLPYFSLQSVILVTGFGLRSNFLHLPLIFIIPAVFDLEDVKRIGWWTLIGMIPMALLMALQFAASPDSFLNVAAGGEGMQMQAGGRVRPPGFFSFISGPIYYASAAAGFLLHAIMAKLPYKPWLLYGSGAALILALGVSGSRSAILSVLIVVASLAAILLIRPSLVNRFGRHLLVGIVLLWAISHLPIFREGLSVLSDRFTEATEETSIIGGLINRMLESFTEAYQLLGWVSLGGRGLGVGTIGGASFLTGEATFLLAENEWSRILLESGPILGLAFIIWRTALTVKLGLFSIRQVSLSNTLPLFLFSTAFFLVLQGTFGQPTSLGFAVVLAGLCLAARPQEARGSEKQESALLDLAALPPVEPRRRSPYAERLHGSSAQISPFHGPADR
jgi:hypothetical protein